MKSLRSLTKTLFYAIILHDIIEREVSSMSGMFEVPETDIFVKAIKQSVEQVMNEEADRIIEQKVEEFKTELTRQKHIAIAGVLHALEVQTQNDPMSLRLNLNLVYRPEQIVKIDKEGRHCI